MATYAEMYALAYAELDFKGRLSMCIAEQAKIFVNDTRPEFTLPATAAIADNAKVTDQFLPLVSSQPGMVEQNEDADLLAAVQSLWPVVGAGYVVAGPPP